MFNISCREMCRLISREQLIYMFYYFFSDMISNNTPCCAYHLHFPTCKLRATGGLGIEPTTPLSTPFFHLKRARRRKASAWFFFFGFVCKTQRGKTKLFAGSSGGRGHPSTSSSGEERSSRREEEWRGEEQRRRGEPPLTAPSREGRRRGGEEVWQAGC